LVFKCLVLLLRASVEANTKNAVKQGAAGILISLILVSFAPRWFSNFYEFVILHLVSIPQTMINFQKRSRSSTAWARLVTPYLDKLKN